LTFPDFETERSSWLSSMPAGVIQALIPNLTQTGDGDGADAPALALEVGQNPSSLSLLNGPDVKVRPARCA
jgi:hypothetical protein